MQLAKVLGNVVASSKHDSLVGVRLLLIQPQDENGVPDGDAIVAADPLQAGVGELVEWTTGREAALALPVTFSPVDCSIVRIVDHAWSDPKYLSEEAHSPGRSHPAPEPAAPPRKGGKR